VAARPPAEPDAAADDATDLHDLGWRREAPDDNGEPVFRHANVWHHADDPRYRLSKGLGGYYLVGPDDAVLGSHANPLQAHQAFLRHRKDQAATAPATSQDQAGEPYLQRAGWRRAPDEANSTVWRHPSHLGYRIRKNHNFYHVHGPRDVLNNRTLVGSFSRPDQAHQAFLRHSNQPRLSEVPKER
jgi:hypothetical protein